MAPQGQLVAGRYRLLRTLATGGTGRLWLAADEVLHRRVVIRRCALPAGLGADEQQVLRDLTMREARALARAGNPHLATILDVLPDADEPWIVMEYVASRSLVQIVREAGPLPPERAAAIGLAVLRGLDATSRTGVLHLAVEPAKVLVGDGGRVVLSDFGPAGAGIPGSPSYVAPERRLGGAHTPRADLWSLGATLHYAVEGRPPDTLPGSPPEPPRRAGPLAGVLEGLLRCDPAERPPISEVEERLRRVAQPPAPAPFPAPTPPRPRHGRWLAAAAAAAVIAVLSATTGSTRDDDRVAAPPTVAASPAARPAPVLPRTFTWWNDPAGFRIAVPRGWRDKRDPTGVLTFTAPDGWPALRISRSAVPPGDVVAALIAEEGEVRSASYRRIRIEVLREPPNAVWEYTYQARSGAQMRCLRRLSPAGGRTYAIEWRAPRTAWAAGLPALDVVLNSFGPVG